MPSVTTIVADTPEASPSSPSVRFAPFDTAVNDQNREPHVGDPAPPLGAGTVARNQPVVVELVVLDERDRRPDAFLSWRHIDRTALAVLGHVLDLGGEATCLRLLLDDDLQD